MGRNIFRIIKTFLLSLILTVVILFALLWQADFVWKKLRFSPQPIYGITFSPLYAQSLNLNLKEVYQSLIGEMKVKLIRLPIYWNLVEEQEGKFDFQLYDELVSKAQEKNVRLILALGYKLPRWPECFAPSWAINLDYQKRQTKTLAYLEKAIVHFKNRANISAWQVENEPLFRFGLCGKTDVDFLEKEVDLVRSKDSRPIIITDSGEIGLWAPSMKLANLLGSSLYKKTWNPAFGFFEYPLPPLYYPLKAQLIKMIFSPKSAEVFISELQAEPWTKGTPTALTPLTEQLEIFSLKQFQDNVEYARKTNLQTNLLWGAEWWYFMKVQGHSEYWDYAKTLFQ